MIKRKREGKRRKGRRRERKNRYMCVIWTCWN
jgi:hypothetical protein